MSSPRTVVAAAPLTALAALALVGACVGWVRRGTGGLLREPAGLPPSGVALVLGAQVYPDGRPSAFLRARLDLAAALLASGQVVVLLLSGDAGATEHDEPAAMRRYLLDHGVPAARIVIDPAGLDTYDSCARAVRVFGLAEVVLVSQRYHLPRAVGTARRLGLRAYGVGDDSVRRRWSWWRGLAREQLACVKTVWDVTTRRDPVLGPPDPAVRVALERAATEGE